MQRQKKDFKLWVVVAILLTIAFLPEAAWAGDWDKISSSLKSTAVGAVKIVSPGYAEKLNNTNVTQTIKSTAGGVVGKLAGPEAGNTVATGRWMNVLTSSGAMTAGKIMTSTAAGALTLNSNVGRNIFTANWTQNLSSGITYMKDVLTNFYRQLNRVFEHAGPVWPKFIEKNRKNAPDPKNFYLNVKMGQEVSYSRYDGVNKTELIPITGNNITTLNEKSWERR